MVYKDKNVLKKIYFVKKYYKINQRRGISAKRIHKNIDWSIPMAYRTMDRYLSALGIKKKIVALGIMQECESFANDKIRTTDNHFLFLDNYTIQWNDNKK